MIGVSPRVHGDRGRLVVNLVVVLVVASGYRPGDDLSRDLPVWAGRLVRRGDSLRMTVLVAFGSYGT
jgi:hypothetical protein